MSQTEEMISEKKDFVPGSSSTSKSFAWWSQSADSRMSASLMVPFEEE